MRSGIDSPRPVDRNLSSPNLSGIDRFAFHVERIEKPWGHELLWALTDRYCGKLIFVRAGQALSLQFHKVKDEAWYIESGRAQLEVAGAGERITESEIVGPGAAFHFRPGTVHRVTALEDTTIFEVSTPEIHDVVRLEDRYGRG
jgi:mannose-6-phosphate isomerase